MQKGFCKDSNDAVAVGLRSLSINIRGLDCSLWYMLIKGSTLYSKRLYLWFFVDLFMIDSPPLGHSFLLFFAQVMINPNDMSFHFLGMNFLGNYLLALCKAFFVLVCTVS